MIILDVNKLSKDFGYGKLFEDISFSLNLTILLIIPLKSPKSKKSSIAS